jgi:hypothetical protein
VDLYTGWDTKNGKIIPDCLVHVAGSAVSSGKQDQINPGISHNLGGVACIVDGSKPSGFS